jgi:hypothetical protein
VVRLKEAIRTIKPHEFPLVSEKEAKKVAKSGEKEVTAVPENTMKEIYQDAVNDILFKYFMKGLREDLYNAVMQARPKDLTDAIHIAEEHEHYSEMFSSGHRMMANMTISDSPPQADHTVTQAAQQLQALNVQSNNGQTRQPTVHFDPSNLSQQRCFYCNKTGHLVRECRKKLSDWQQGQRPPPMQSNNGAQLQPRLPGLRPVRSQASGGAYQPLSNQGKARFRTPYNRIEAPQQYSNGNPRYQNLNPSRNMNNRPSPPRQQVQYVSHPKNGLRLPQRAGIQIPRSLEAKRPQII